MCHKPKSATDKPGVRYVGRDRGNRSSFSRAIFKVDPLKIESAGLESHGACRRQSLSVGCIMFEKINVADYADELAFIHDRHGTKLVETQ